MDCSHSVGSGSEVLRLIGATPMEALWLFVIIVVVFLPLLLWSAAGRHSEPGRPVSLCGTLTSAGSLRRCSSSSGGCYLDASGTSVLNQRLTAASTLSTRATPTSRAALLTRKPDASNINLRERGEKRKTTVRSLLLLLLACLLSIYLCIYYYVITCMLCIYFLFASFWINLYLFKAL